MFNFKFFKELINYLGSFPNVMSENSTKLLALLISAIAGGFVAIFVVPFCLIWDVVTNNYIKTDLTGMGIFLLCLGGFQLGAGVNVKVPTWMAKGGKKIDGRIGRRMEDMDPFDRPRRGFTRSEGDIEDEEEYEVEEEEPTVDGLLNSIVPDPIPPTKTVTTPIKCINSEGKVLYFKDKKSCANVVGVTVDTIGKKLKNGGKTVTGYHDFSYLDDKEMKKYNSGKLAVK
jgi:hypothetical protein